jgi:hypothetical protein
VFFLDIPFYRTRKIKISLSAITYWSGIIQSSAFVTRKKAKGWATREKVPAGVQVFPSSITGIPNGSGCTYGSGSCGGVIFGAQEGQNQTPLQLPPDFKISITVFESLLGLKQTVIHDNSAPGINPPSWGNFVHVFLPCYGSQLINNFFGSDDKAAITLATNLSVVAAPTPITVIAAGAWDLQATGRAGIACAIIARRRWTP